MPPGRPPLCRRSALQALGGELDRRQRVLDFVRNAPCDVGPCGAALVEHLLGNVLEAEHETVALRDRLGVGRRGFGLGARDADASLIIAAVYARGEYGREVCRRFAGSALTFGSLQ